MAATESVRDEALRAVRAAGWHAESWDDMGDGYFALNVDKRFGRWRSRESFFMNLNAGDLMVSLDASSGCP